MKIGDLAAQTGIPASTIRYYERIGLIAAPPRRSGRRDFGPQTISELRFIRLAQAGGFSIAEILPLLKPQGADRPDRATWAALLETKRKAVGDRIAELQAVDAMLTDLLDCHCAARTDCVQPALHRHPSP